jgi:hypothetical protein
MAIENADLILFALFVVMAVLITYSYGFSKGENSLRARSDLVRPSLKDIQIEGTFRVKKENLDDVLKKIIKEEEVHRNFYNIYRQGNRIIFSSSRIKPNVKDYLKALGNLRPGIPNELELFFKEENDDYYLIDTLCRPVMYYQISQSVRFDFLQSNIEDAQAQCYQFTKEIMNCLNATIVNNLITIKKDESFIYNYYSNTPMDNEIDVQVQQMLSNALHEILYCGWIDREFLGYLEKAKEHGANVRIITRSPEGSSKTVKNDFERLKASFQDNVKMNNLLHDRFIVCDDNLIIGSFYLTSDSKTRYESVISTSDEKLLNKAKKHFELIWNDKNSKKA